MGANREEEGGGEEGGREGERGPEDCPGQQGGSANQKPALFRLTNDKSSLQVRREIWEWGAGEVRRLHRTTSAQAAGEATELASMSVADLNKRFINTFLYLQVSHSLLGASVYSR